MAQSARTAPLPTPRPPRKLTYEEFLNWPGENQHVEWVDGEVIEMSPVAARHDEIVRFLGALLLTLC